MSLFITINHWQCRQKFSVIFFWVALPFLQMQHDLFCVRYHQGDQWNSTTLKSCPGLSYTAWMFSKTVENKISRHKNYLLYLTYVIHKLWCKIKLVWHWTTYMLLHAFVSVLNSFLFQSKHQREKGQGNRFHRISLLYEWIHYLNNKTCHFICSILYRCL